MSAEWPRRNARAWVFGLAAIAALLVIVVTREGMVVSPDSVSYVAVARNLADGHVLVSYTGYPLSHWPPGYPVLLSVGLKLGVSVVTWARLINALSAAAMVVLTYVIATRKLSQRLAVIAAAIVALLPGLLGVERAVWSEPVFGVVVLLFLLSLDVALERPASWAAAPGAVAGVAVLVRYLGFSLLVAGAVVIVVIEWRRWREVAVRLGFFGATAAVVVVPWLVHNYDVSGSATGSVGSATAGWARTSRALVEGLGRLVVPSDVPSKAAKGGTVVAVVLLAGVWLWCRPSWRSVRRVLAWLATAAAIVGFATVTSITGTSDVDERILAPASPAIVLCIVWLYAEARRAVETRSGRRPMQVAVVAAPLLVLVLLAGFVVESAWSDGRAGRQYASSSVRDSAVVRAVGGLPSNTVVLADDPLAIAYWTGRRILVPGDGGRDGAGAPLVTAREVRRLACRGAVAYVRAHDPGHPARSFARAAQGSLDFRAVQTLGDVDLVEVRPTDAAPCA